MSPSFGGAKGVPSRLIIADFGAAMTGREILAREPKSAMLTSLAARAFCKKSPRLRAC